MTSKKKILVIVAALLFIVLLFLLIWFLLKQQPIPETIVVVEELIVQTDEPRRSEPEDVKKIPEAEPVQPSGLESLGKTFAERYGSYSNQSDFANLYDVLDLMSVSLRAETENFLENAVNSDDYYGVTTRVLSIKVLSLDEAAGQADLEISTQREESKGGPELSEIKYQILQLGCVKEGEVWKIQSARWQ